MVISCFFPLEIVGIGREIPIMIQQEAEFDCPLGPPELGPVSLSQALGLSRLVEHHGNNDPELNPLPKRSAPYSLTK
jgi:hypothetical protein